MAALLPEAMLATQASLTLVLFARLGGFFLVTPFFSDEAIAGPIRALLAFALTIALSGLLAPRLPALPPPGIAFALLLLGELVIGLALGLLIRLFFLAAQMAGALISLQIGLTTALAIDPASGGQVPLLARFTGLAALLLYLALGVHHLWLAAIVDSYRVFPVGGGMAAGDMLPLALHSIGRGMTIAVSLAAPLTVYGILFNLALGLIARLTPALQVFFMAQPLSLALGFLLVAATMGLMLETFAVLHQQWLADLWGRMTP